MSSLLCAKMTFVDSCALSFRLFTTLFIRKKFLCISARRFHMDIKNESKSAMEIVNVPPIVSIFRHATQTFDNNHRNDLATNLSKLKVMMDSLKPEDLGFDNTLSDPSFWRKPMKAPCTYIEVYQDSNINMSIFVLKPGFKMPLHDHPHMHGFLKVISGAVHIRTFTEHPLTQEQTPAIAGIAKYEAARLSKGIHSRRKLFAEVTTSRVCKANAETCILTPTVSNYHEIQALELPAAFFDILAPPYDTFIEDIGPRRCRYYNVAKEISTNLVELQETEVPDCFYCDHAPYLGPILT